jgi:hypothetical protein
MHVSARTLSGQETRISRATLDAFGLSLGGRLILPDSEATTTPGVCGLG